MTGASHLILKKKVENFPIVLHHQRKSKFATSGYAIHVLITRQMLSQENYFKDSHFHFYFKYLITSHNSTICLFCNNLCRHWIRKYDNCFPAGRILLCNRIVDPVLFIQLFCFVTFITVGRLWLVFFSTVN